MCFGAFDPDTFQRAILYQKEGLWSQMWDNIGCAFRCIAVLVFYTRFRSSCHRSGFCIGLCLDLCFVFRSLHRFRSLLCFQIFASIQIFALFSILVLSFVASLLLFVYEFRSSRRRIGSRRSLLFAVSLNTCSRFSLILLVSFFIFSCPFSYSSFNILWVITSSCCLHARGTAVIFPR